MPSRRGRRRTAATASARTAAASSSSPTGSALDSDAVALEAAGITGENETRPPRDDSQRPSTPVVPGERAQDEEQRKTTGGDNETTPPRDDSQRPSTPFVPGERAQDEEQRKTTAGDNETTPPRDDSQRPSTPFVPGERAQDEEQRKTTAGDNETTPLRDDSERPSTPVVPGERMNEPGTVQTGRLVPAAEARAAGAPRCERVRKSHRLAAETVERAVRRLLAYRRGILRRFPHADREEIMHIICTIDAALDTHEDVHHVRAFLAETGQRAPRAGEADDGVYFGDFATTFWCLCQPTFDVPEEQFLETVLKALHEGVGASQKYMQERGLFMRPRHPGEDAPRR